ncbi:heme peroxidase family protein [Streptomyces sp. NPDC059070]|uniref:peroxidase family protein n=1 Tax=Streptomyces sp. NPDC059070 TaxID=3346713 RepID=UPI00369A8044
MSATHGSTPCAHAGANATSGDFVRMFPNLPPRKATGLPLALRYGAPGGLVDGGQTSDGQLHPEVPAGFTFLGQFIDHDLTLDVLSVLGGRAEPASLTDFRTPRLDMDSVYGAGPVVSRHLYDGSPQGKLAVNPNGADFARIDGDVARIGDPRNDENMLLAQLHLQMIKFHNRVTDLLAQGQITDAFGRTLPPKPADEPPTQQPGATLDQLLDVDNYYEDLHASAKRLVQWHYQWIVLHEFLPNFLDPAVLSDIVDNGPRFFDAGERPVIPVEFSAAGFRAFHSTIRSSYRINERFSGKLFPDNPDAPASPRADLRGGPVLPEHAIDWRFFFDVSRSLKPQTTRRVQGSINTQLLDLPVSAVPGAKPGALARPVASLAVRNLLRSETVGLPSGQDVARAIGDTPLTEAELGTAEPSYLWYYILKEAEVRARGRHFGPVGSRIIGETVVGLLKATPSSYHQVFPAWRPTLGETPGRFEMTDLLYLAGSIKD